MNRREALKVLGAAVAGSSLGGLPLRAEEVLQPERRRHKVLLVNGSPNREGCTYTALSEIAATLRKHEIDSEIIQLGRAPVSGCIDCGFCRVEGRCVIDDLVNEFVKKAKVTDGFIFGAPVHYASPAGSLISFMDRVFYSSARDRVLYGKPAAAVVSCRRAGSTASLDVLNKYFGISGMPTVPSQYWNMVHGSNPDQVRQDIEGLQIMRTLAGNMAWLLNSIAAGKEAGHPFPEYEAFTPTNFIR